MWSLDKLTIEVSDVEHEIMLVAITTPLGRIDFLGHVSVRDGWLWIEAAHVQGLRPGALGRAGMNAIARKLMGEADVQGVVVEGSTRTTGRAQGRIQRAFRFPNPLSPSGDG